MLSILGWINGISITGIVMSGVIIGLLGIIQAKRYNAKLLYYASLTIICLSCLWLGNFVDFLSIIFTGKNLDNSIGLYGYLNYFSVGPAVMFGLILVVELVYPNKSRFVIPLAIILAIIYELIFFTYLIDSINFIYPKNSGDELLDEEIKLFSPVGYFMIFAVILAITGVLILFIKGIKAEGILRKKFSLIAVGCFIYLLFGILDGFIPADIISIIIFRVGIIFGVILYYYGVREETIEKPKFYREIEIEGNLFRLSKINPGNVTAEQVTLYKEQKICLVCKREVSRFIFVCSKCSALYCENCVHSLSDLENACWVCNTPFDESKPSKPFLNDKEEIKLLEKKDQSPKK